MREIAVYLFQMHEPEPRKLLAIALILVGVWLKLALSARTPLRAFSLYLIAASGASLLQRSPLWGLWAEIAVAIVAGFAVWEGIARVNWQEHRWFGFCIGALLFATLLWVEPKPYPMFSESVYYVKLFGSTFLFAACIGAEIGCWSDGFGTRRHLPLLAAWFLIKLLACFKWSDRYPEFDVWWVLATSSAGQIVCLLFWLARSERTSTRYLPSDSAARGSLGSGALR